MDTAVNKQEANNFAKIYTCTCSTYYAKLLIAYKVSMNKLLFSTIWLLNKFKNNTYRFFKAQFLQIINFRSNLARTKGYLEGF